MPKLKKGLNFLINSMFLNPFLKMNGNSRTFGFSQKRDKLYKNSIAEIGVTVTLFWTLIGTIWKFHRFFFSFFFCIFSFFFAVSMSFWGMTFSLFCLLTISSVWHVFFFFFLMCHLNCIEFMVTIFSYLVSPLFAAYLT